MGECKLQGVAQTNQISRKLTGAQKYVRTYTHTYTHTLVNTYTNNGSLESNQVAIQSFNSLPCNVAFLGFFVIFVSEHLI